MPENPRCFYCGSHGYVVAVDSYVEGELPILVCRLCLYVGIADGRIEEYRDRPVVPKRLSR